VHHHNHQGDKVKPAEHNANTASTPKSGIFALLCALLGVGGTRASKITQGTPTPKTTRRLLLPVLVTTLGALAFTAFPGMALAAAPETPETGKANPASITATTATLEDGVLNPSAAGEVGEYEYRFRVSATECEGESSTTPEAAAGNEKEAVPPMDLTNLQPDAHYTFCLIEHNLAGEYSLPSTPEHFTTKAAPPEIVSESASGVNSKEATLNAEVNANNQETKYVFEYSKTEAAGKLTGTIVKVNGAAPIPKEEFGPRGVSVPTTAVLAAGTTYFYRVVSTNEKAEKTEGVVESFTTVPTPHTEAPSLIGTTTATFNGKLTPLNPNVETEYSFDYRIGSECTGENSTTTEKAGKGSGSKTVSEPVTGLQPNQTYSVCLVSKNAFGEEVDPASPPVHFTTKPAPPTIESESASNITSSEVTFEGTVNSNNQLTECHFQYVDEEEFLKTGFTKAAEVACSPEQLKGFGPQSVGPKNAEGAASPTGVSEGTVYHYQIVTKNGDGEVATGPDQRFQTFETPEQKPATEVSKTAWELHGVLNPNHERKEEPGGYEFVYRQSSGECRYVLSAGEAQSIEAEIAEARAFKDEAKLKEKQAELNADRAKEAENKHTTEAAASGAQGQAVEAEVPGLLPGAPYTVCLLVRNGATNQAAITGQETFTTVPAPPTIAGESASNVDETAATLEAEIDPEGAATTVHFEYLTQAQYEADGKTFGSGTVETAESGSIDLNDEADHLTLDSIHHVTPVRIPESEKPALTPGTNYEYRVVATNECKPGEPGKQCVKDGEGKTFTTAAPQTTNSKECANEQARAEQPYGLELPDCRAYEMVSPLATAGQDATDSFVAGGPRASVCGKECEERGDPAITYASAGDFADPTGDAFVDQFVSRRNAKEGHWETQAITLLHDPIKTEPVSSYEAGDFTPELTAGIATTNAQLTSEAPVPTTETGYQLYVANFVNDTYRFVGSGLNTVGSSADLSHVVYGEYGSVGEWVNGGKEVPVSVTNTPGVGIEGTVGSQHHNSSLVRDHEVWHAVSASGSRVYFTSPASGNSGVLYVRVNAEQSKQSPVEHKGEPDERCTVSTDACTIEVSASQRTTPDPNGPQTAHYWGASAEGEKVFFTSKAELTEDAKTGPADNAPNLYEYDLDRPAGERLKDLTVDDTDTEGAAVQGVVQISEEGQYVYFVAKGVLKGEHKEALRNSAGEEPVAEAENLYVSHEGGAPVFIATLAAGDIPDWQGADLVGSGPYEQQEDESGPVNNNAVVTPGGTRLAFVSERSLPTANFPAGYDNHDANTGDPDDEIYLYTAGSGGTGSLTCASCNPNGARPVGSSSLSGANKSFALYRPRDLVEEARGDVLFFNSSDALVPHSSDGRQNVYEYEEGHVYPISNVAGGQASFFLDASASGDDVFFGTADQLLPEDTSNNVVVWDARKEGGFPVTVAASACTNADSCKPPVSPQPEAFGAPASATFSAPGYSLTPPPPPPPAVVKPKAKVVKCKKGFVKNSKDKCVKRKKAKKAKKSTHIKGSK
jgi:hypothetical protein